MRALLVLLGCLLVAPLATAADPGVGEYSLKAVLLYRLPQFVYWPQSEKPPATAVICIHGSNPFGSMLLQLAHNGSGSAEIRHLEGSNPSWSGCDVLYISRSEAAQLETLLQRAEGRRLLTVSDISGFARSGGMVELLLNDNRVSLILNRKNAQARGFDFNAQLLRLAQRVIEAP